MRRLIMRLPNTSVRDVMSSVALVSVLVVVSQMAWAQSPSTPTSTQNAGSDTASKFSSAPPVPSSTKANQPPDAAQSTGSEKNLTDGLLDLLTEPSATKPMPDSNAMTPKGSTSAPRRDGREPGGQSGAGQPKPSAEQLRKPSSDLKGEDLGQAPGVERSNPLFEVRVAMSAVSDLLRSPREAEKAKQLQSDIVSRLDELIGTLAEQAAPEQSNQPSQAGDGSSSSQEPSGSQSGSQSGNQSQNQTVTSQSSASGQTATRASEAEMAAGEQGGARGQSSNASRRGNSQTGDSNSGQDGAQGSAEDKGQQRPGADSAPGSSPQSNGNGSPSELAGQSSATNIGNRQAMVDLSDPAALQRSAWGNLPERVREQMQSRMVERFLPGYRQEIEAYYRALAK